MPDFCLAQHTRTGKNITNAHKIYQLAKHIPNCRTIFPKAVKYTNIFHSKALQKYTKLGFENRPSGNPVHSASIVISSKWSEKPQA
jgi:hypothetical protein